ncbi:hypothetical protein [Hoyosella subflava]|uniref:Uncharacterized protein n=1 Tax=Hoyosella subflava (strain DSM 45089 / JCM 17490 / NBRC 109087 / DQS3-9A1) TaxID=443218 RepID=F6ENY4_HOYSD|nr:hypothetical protein [Hoyosella subflava]AEF40450.1 hypothetical protein AS9A_2001 [Hoyosella subflava DQS3-9A1]
MLHEESIVARAFGYPYERPAGSFVFEAPATVRPFIPGQIPLHSRTPVLAVGSNASAVQMNRKFGCSRASEPPIPVLAAVLSDHDVVYAARISRYGAVPGSLARSPGTRLDVHIMFLTDAQRDVLDRSEGVNDDVPGYSVAEIGPQCAACEVEVSGPLRTYRATRGHLNAGGETIALSAVSAHGRTMRALDERTILSLVAENFRLTARDLVVRTVRDETFRRRVLTELARDGIPY